MDGQYHRIQQVIYDYDTNQLHFTIFHYVGPIIPQPGKRKWKRKRKIQRYYELEAKKQEYDEKNRYAF